MASSCLNQQKLEECKQFLTRLLDDEDLKSCTFNSSSCFGWTEAELEGEIVDILIRFLRKKNCPVILLAPFVSLSRSRFLELDLTTCKLENTEDCQVQDYDAVAISKALFDVFKKVCSEAEQNIDILAVKEIPQKSHVIVHSIKNTRRKMEDQHCWYEDLNTIFALNEMTQEQSLFGVFDGHGGAEAADFAASQLVCELKSCECLISDPGEALKTAIMKVDTNFLVKAKKEKLKSGCTAVVVLIQGVNLSVGWLGDSQVVLCKNGQAIQLMETHKPDREDERQRISALGGCVVFFNGWRVNGTLAVSRAIGDLEHKPFITGKPDIEEYEMEGDEEFLILGCDGLYDTVEPLEAVTLVQQCISEGVRDEAAEKLVNLAKENKSTDNITVMVVYLDFNKRSDVTPTDTGQVVTPTETPTTPSETPTTPNETPLEVAS